MKIWRDREVEGTVKLIICSQEGATKRGCSGHNKKLGRRDEDNANYKKVTQMRQKMESSAHTH